MKMEEEVVVAAEEEYLPDNAANPLDMAIVPMDKMHTTPLLHSYLNHHQQ